VNTTRAVVYIVATLLAVLSMWYHPQVHRTWQRELDKLPYLVILLGCAVGAWGVAMASPFMEVSEDSTSHTCTSCGVCRGGWSSSLGGHTTSCARAWVRAGGARAASSQLTLHCGERVCVCSKCLPSP